MRGSIQALLFGGIPILFSMPVSAKPLLTETIHYYTIAPHDPEDLIPLLNQQSPIRENQHIYYGHTQTRIDWKFWWSFEDSRCWIDRVETSVNTTFTLPRLTSSYPEVNRIWGLWYPNLVKHENHHRDLAISIAQQIEQGIRHIEEQNNCPTLERNANNLGKAFLKKLEELNQEYDQQTQHGTTEGARIRDYLNP